MTLLTHRTPRILTPCSLELALPCGPCHRKPPLGDSRRVRCRIPSLAKPLATQMPLRLQTPSRPLLTVSRTRRFLAGAETNAVAWRISEPGSEQRRPLSGNGCRKRGGLMLRRELDAMTVVPLRRAVKSQLRLPGSRERNQNKVAAKTPSVICTPREPFRGACVLQLTQN